MANLRDFITSISNSIKKKKNDDTGFFQQGKFTMQPVKSAVQNWQQKPSNQIFNNTVNTFKNIPQFKVGITGNNGYTPNVFKIAKPMVNFVKEGPVTLGKNLVDSVYQNKDIDLKLKELKSDQSNFEQNFAKVRQLRSQGLNDQANALVKLTTDQAKTKNLSDIAQTNKTISDLGQKKKQTISAGIKTAQLLPGVSKVKGATYALGGLLGGGINALQGKDFYEGVGQGVVNTKAANLLLQGANPVENAVVNSFLSKVKSPIVRQFVGRSLSGLTNVGEDEALAKLDSQQPGASDRLMSFGIGFILNSSAGGDYKLTDLKKDIVKQINTGGNIKSSFKLDAKGQQFVDKFANNIISKYKEYQALPKEKTQGGYIRFDTSSEVPAKTAKTFGEMGGQNPSTNVQGKILNDLAKNVPGFKENPTGIIKDGKINFTYKNGSFDIEPRYLLNEDVFSRMKEGETVDFSSLIGQPKGTPGTAKIISSTQTNEPNLSNAGVAPTMGIKVKKTVIPQIPKTNDVIKNQPVFKIGTQVEKPFEVNTQPNNTNEYINQMVKNQDEAIKGEKIPLKSKVQKEIADAKSRLVDMYSPIEDPLRQAQKEGNYKILPKNDIHYQIDKVLRSGGVSSQFMKDNGLTDIVQNLPKEEDNAFNQYLIARHAPEVTAKGFETGRNLEADKKLVQELAPKYEEQAKQVDAYASKLLDYSVNTGLVSKEVADNLKKQYPNYVPLNRLFSELEQEAIPENIRQGTLSLSKQTVVQKLKGSERAMRNPLESLIEKTITAFNQGERNVAGKMLASYKDLPNNPLGIVEIKKGESGKNTFSYLDNGIKRTFETTPEVATAAKNLDVQQLGLAGQILAMPVRLAKVGITGAYTPFVTSNIAKDQVTGIINSDKALQTSVLNPDVFLKSLWTAVGHGEEYDNWVRSAAGGTSFDMYRGNPKQTIATIRSNKNIGSKIGYTVTKPSELLRATEDIIGRGEELTRLQQFIGTRNALLKEGRTLEDANLLAADASRNNTVNFYRMGSWGKALNSVFIYLNASIQGGRTLTRSLIEKPLQTATKIALTTFIPVAAVTAWNLSDPKRKAAYEDIRTYEKDGNIIIVPPNPTIDEKTGKWNVIKIPMSQEVANLSVPIRKSIEAMQGYDGPTFGDFNNAIIGSATGLEMNSPSQLLGSFIPQAIKPGIEMITNKDLFTGADIVPQYINGEKSSFLSPEEQVKDNTSGTARLLSKPLGVSPLKTEKFIKSSVGGLGMEGLNISDRILNKLGIIPEEQIGGETLGEGFAKRFTNAAGGQNLSNMFDTVDKYNTGKKSNIDLGQSVVDNGKVYFLNPSINSKTGKQNVSLGSVKLTNNKLPTSNANSSTNMTVSNASIPSSGSKISDTLMYDDKNNPIVKTSEGWKKIDFEKANALPEGTNYEKAVKSDTVWKIASNVMGQDISDTDKNTILKSMGIDANSASYYQIADQNQDIRSAMVMDKLGTAQSSNDVVKILLDGMYEINGKSIVTSALLNDLVKQGVITKDLKDYVLSTYAKSTGQTTSGGSSARKKGYYESKFSELKKISLPKTKTSSVKIILPKLPKINLKYE